MLSMSYFHMFLMFLMFLPIKSNVHIIKSAYIVFDIIPYSIGMLRIKSISLTLLMFVAFTGCSPRNPSQNVNHQQQADENKGLVNGRAHSDSGSKSASLPPHVFYPLSGDEGGDVVQMKAQENPFKFPVGFYGIKKIHVNVYSVDKDSFFMNSHHGYAGFEGQLDLSKFKYAIPIFQGDMSIFRDSDYKDDSYTNGHVELPVAGPGFYYLVFIFPDIWGDGGSSDAHILLEVNERSTDFIYSN